ncbi:MAG: YraN family protein [Gaiellaceae bacterium]
MPKALTRSRHRVEGSTRSAGARAERRARLHYRLRGYRILDANAWAGGYELDLVARRGQTIVFCEVKQKAGPRFGDPAEMVTEEKQRRIRRAAEAWLAARPALAGLQVRFDVVTITPRGVLRLADVF